VLAVLGMEDVEESAYRALVGMASADEAELAERLRIGRAEAARVLASLERQGLAARSSGSQQRYVASPPSVALAALARARQEELHRAETEIAELADLYRRADTLRGAGDVVDVVHGAAAVGQRFVQLQAAAREEVSGFVMSEVAVVSAEDNTAEDAAVDRGVTYRIVVEQSAVRRPGFLSAAEDAVARGELVRVAPTVPIRMIVVDRQIALVPLISEEDGAVGGLLVHSSGLLDALLALFDKVWRDSMPLIARAGLLAESAGDDGIGGALDELDTKVLGLLLAGLTDEAIGGHLGLSLRTVQRRVRALMDAAGVQTRVQLGYQAAARGWVAT
jgi:sugar-specific transcriptional regulator TrmB